MQQSHTERSTYMNYTLRNKIYQLESEIMSEFDMSAFRNFVTLFYFEKIDDEHTLGGEIAAAYSMTAKGRSLTIREEDRNLYSRNAFRAVETSEEEKLSTAKNMYLRAGRKICFLNSRAVKLIGRGFLGRKFNRDDVAEMAALAEAFVDMTKA